jgi:uncharacterized membrane-anchored protein YhcB (DUF1043 family)
MDYNITEFIMTGGAKIQDFMGGAELITSILITYVFGIIIGIAIFYFFNELYMKNNKDDDIKEIKEIKNNRKIIINQLNSEPPILVDRIQELDYRQLMDPLVEPAKRPPRHIMDTIVNSPYFNYPTRGFTDSFSHVGYLIDENSKEGDENKIIRLFGREKYPRSSEHEYYIEIRVGLDKIKYTLDKQRRELFDGDNVYVDIVKKNYKVNILKNKSLEYNPYII